jgi:YidC/Oxa1 family membrane protein insertase
MDRRLVLAIGLMLIVALLPSILFPPKQRASRGDQILTDSVPPIAPDTVAPGGGAGEPAPPARELVVEPVVPDTTRPVATEDSVVVESPIYRYVFSTRGARLISATLKGYRSFAANDTGLVQLMPQDAQFLQYSLVFGNDTLSVADWIFQPSQSTLRVEQAGASLEWVARRGAAEMRLRHTFLSDDYRFDLSGEFSGFGAEAGLVLVSLGPRHRLVEADSTWDFRSYAIVTKARSAERTSFSSLDPGERVQLAGPFEWVAVKSRYFLTAVLTIREGEPRIGGAVATGGERQGKYAKRADAVASLPAPGGRFSHAVYIGPQEFRRLAHIGHGLEDVNPYGWVLRPIIQPIANIIARILVWMHQTFSVAYGWVLILFGIAVRIVLWPLNQKAMRSSMAMQAVQPEIKAIQERYKQDPQQLQKEMMKLYKEHGVNPLGGCLPMLLPMPVLFALFFVFRETIEFRGVPWLWIPDLSRADPLYIIPVVMGLSMFVVSKLGQRGVPPNPQTKMMLYFMPGMLTVLFLKFSAGLNLYYAVSNIASIPQQWMISQERLRRVGKVPAKK